MKLAKEVYLSTKNFPQDEKYGITSQIRRSVVSIPSNIAEGHTRDTTAQYCHFINIAMGSCSELETQLLLSLDLQYGEKELLQSNLNLLTEVSKMLFSLKKTLDSRL